ncbi:MAG: hypothetical protein J5580_02655 [Clostridia bacterium]|nr:hypothetical protein [Clostridia bacterium]
MLEKIRDLNNICSFTAKDGLYKQWIYKENDYMKMCDYMQKINYSLQDLNSEIENLENACNKDVVFIISLVDWVSEAYEKIFNLIDEKIKSGFVFTNETEFEKRKQYLKAIRSFVVGHPLSTTRHENYELDGNFICVDIRNPKNSLNLFPNTHYYKLRFDGLFSGRDDTSDYNLYCYSDKDDNMKYFRIVGCKFEDLYNVARIYIDKLYELNGFLKSKKKKDYEVLK